MKTHPTREGIAVPVWELSLPDSRYGWEKKKYQNNHHGHYTSKKFGQLAVTQCLRDLERYQYMLPVDVHNWFHDTYAAPPVPSEEQAARAVIDAYEHGEYFKRYDRYTHRYRYDEIPPELVDRFIAKYGLRRVVVDMGMAAD